jgi:hypothetical protein
MYTNIKNRFSCVVFIAKYAGRISGITTIEKVVTEQKNKCKTKEYCKKRY